MSVGSTFCCSAVPVPASSLKPDKAKASSSPGSPKPSWADDLPNTLQAPWFFNESEPAFCPPFGAPCHQARPNAWNRLALRGLDGPSASPGSDGQRVTRVGRIAWIIGGHRGYLVCPGLFGPSGLSGSTGSTGSTGPTGSFALTVSMPGLTVTAKFELDALALISYSPAGDVASAKHV